MKRTVFVPLLLLIASLACSSEGNFEPTPIPTPITTPIPSGILRHEIQNNMDILFDEVRHVLSDRACLNEDFEVYHNIIMVPYFISIF